MTPPASGRVMPKLNEVEPKTAFAERVGLTKGRISQVHKAAIAKAAAHIARRGAGARAL